MFVHVQVHMCTHTRVHVGASVQPLVLFTGCSLCFSFFSFCFVWGQPLSLWSGIHWLASDLQESLPVSKPHGGDNKYRPPPRGSEDQTRVLRYVRQINILPTASSSQPTNFSLLRTGGLNVKTTENPI